jgi:3-hydroxybutyryl-CoA dehydrogenase
VPVLIQKDIPGFALNRLQFAVLREALHLVETGVISPVDVDRVMSYGLGFRYPWLGPLMTADLGGLDVFYTISSYLFKELSTMRRPPKSLDRLVKKGKLGLKTGQGFYDFRKGTMEKVLRKRDLYFVRQWKLIQELQSI